MYFLTVYRTVHAEAAQAKPMQLFSEKRSPTVISQPKVKVRG